MSAEATRAGAQALLELLNTIHTVTEGSFPEDIHEDDLDPRDYTAIGREIEQSLSVNVMDAEPAHREGYVRALADLLCCVADGCLPDLDDWDPIGTTEPAYVAPREMQDLLRRVQQ